MVYKIGCKPRRARVSAFLGALIVIMLGLSIGFMTGCMAIYLNIK